MSNEQLFLVIGVPLVFNLLGFLLLNSRISSVELGLHKRIDDLEKYVDNKIDNAFEHVELLLKLHESEHHKGEN